MIKRQLSTKLKELVKKFPILAITGPRQSGKTTLTKMEFPDYTYISMEDPDVQLWAKDDPRGFLEQNDKYVIIDEIQRVPDLFSYLQTHTDGSGITGQYIISGSQSFLLSEKISQSLAGRAVILNLLPFSLYELSEKIHRSMGLDDFLFRGFFPRIYDKNINPVDFYPSYIQAYIERDVRQIKNVTNLYDFNRFLKLCAGRTGQLLNLTSLANDCGISVNTAKAWISVLEQSFIIFLLKPYYRNFNKRTVKMPKLYFYDTGLICSLLGLEDKKQLMTHYLRGSLFENFIILEILKSRFNNGRSSNLYFWRNNHGNEIDCVVEKPDNLYAIEIKSGRTFSSDFFRGINYWNKIAGSISGRSFVVYGGKTNRKTPAGELISWENTKDLIHTINAF